MKGFILIGDKFTLNFKWLISAECILTGGSGMPEGVWWEERERRRKGRVEKSQSQTS